MTAQQQNAVRIAEELRKAGVTLAGAAGIVANLEAESALNPQNVEDRSGIADDVYTREVDNGSYTRFIDDAYGYGLAQWTYWSRKQALLNSARRRGVSIGDLEMQVDFLIAELQSDYKALWSILTTSNDAELCASRFCLDFERPANADIMARQRANRAANWYTFLANAAPSTPEPEVDDEGITIPKTWPPRTIDIHCSEWPEVWLLQAALKCRGYNVLVDGIFAEALDKKVKTYQKENGLDADGIVGRMTWKTLLEM